MLNGLALYNGFEAAPKVRKKLLMHISWLEGILETHDMTSQLAAFISSISNNGANAGKQWT
jgi:hypothetical protein